MSAGCFSCITFVSCFLLVSSQGALSTADHTTQTLYLKKTWDGDMLANNTEIPVSFTTLASGDSKHIIVSFNSSSINVEEEKFLTPNIFGVFFMGEENAIVQVEVVKEGKSNVTFYNGFDKPIVQKEIEKVEFNESITQATNAWNGTIAIPVNFLPRGTDQLSAYANYTEAPHVTRVLTLKSAPKDEKMTTELPNLLKPVYFMPIKIKTDVSKMSPLWAEMTGKTPGGAMANQTESKPDAIKDESGKTNEGSIIEQGLVTWILVSAIFCGMLHIFVLAL